MDESGSGPKSGRMLTDKKLDYFVKQPGTSPIRHTGAKSPSPAQAPAYPMVSLNFALFFF